MSPSTRNALRNVRRVASIPGSFTRGFSVSPLRSDSIAFKINGAGNGVAQHIAVPGSSHTIRTDAYATFGGADSAPSPLHYNLIALSSCAQVTGSIVAKELGLTLGKWDIDVVGHLDPAVLAKGEADNGNGGNWNAVDLTVKVGAKSVNKAKFDHWTREVERRCPVTQLFKKSGVKWKSEWTQV